MNPFGIILFFFRFNLRVIEKTIGGFQVSTVQGMGKRAVGGFASQGNRAT
jgi:hypothetical protein